MSTTSNTTPNDITVFRGDDFATQLVFSDTNNCVIDITGWTLFFTIKRRLEDPDSSALVALNVTPTTPTTGTQIITVPNAQLKSLVGQYFYDFRFINMSGTIVTITSGVITFLDHATRRS